MRVLHWQANERSGVSTSELFVSLQLLSRLWPGARLAVYIMIIFVQALSYIIYLPVVCLAPPVLLNRLGMCASFAWPEAEIRATNGRVLLNPTAIRWAPPSSSSMRS